MGFKLAIKGLTLALYYRGTEDDSEGVETCRPNMKYYVTKTCV